VDLSNITQIIVVNQKNNPEIIIAWFVKEIPEFEERAEK